MFTDTHCHLYHEYYDDIDKIIKESITNHVNRFIVAGCDNKSNHEVMDILPKYDCIYGCLGIHPEEVNTYQEGDIQYIKDHVHDEKIVAIGEIGLDYFFSKENKEEQKKLFASQLEIANQYHLPVVIHSREATLDTIEILKQYPNVHGVIHSFSGSVETARIYIHMGYKLGINGVITFKNSHLKEILPEMLPHIVLETDSPYLTPHPFRGSQNSPKYILNIAEFICQECNISLDKLEDITNQNIHSIFLSFQVKCNK